jgi:hypothetical protein
MTETIYRKVNHRYIPIGVYEPEQQYKPIGAHLVIVSPGCTSTRYNISLDEAVVLAAVQNVRKALVDALTKAVVMQPSKRELNALEYRGQEAYIAVAGLPVMLAFEGLSMSDLVDKALEVLKRELLEKSVSCEAQDLKGLACGKIENF